MRLGSHQYQQTQAHDMKAEYIELHSDRESSKKNKNVCHRTLPTNGWGLEFLSSLTSVVLFIGLIVMFRIMDGKQYSEWTFSISLNAVTAILSTCCSAAMMHNVSAFIGQQKWIHLKKSPRTVYDIETFDEASRGPYGSILLLLRIPCNIGTLGALITILRLGFSPFSQAAVNLEPRMVDIFNNSSNFGYAHAYDRPVFQPGPNYGKLPGYYLKTSH
jgi:succinate dehydrogenase hydrophobic anchor subunit